MVLKQQPGDAVNDEGDNEEAQGNKIEYLMIIETCPAEVYEITDWEQSTPGTNVDKALEERAEDGWAFHAADMQQDAGQHTEYTELIPGQEHFPQIEMQPGFLLGCCMFCLVILSKRETEQNQQYVLKGTDNLCVGKTDLVVEDEGTESGKCSDIGEHGTHHIGTAVKKISVLAGKKHCTDEAWQQYVEKAEERQPEKLRRKRQDPET